MWRNFNFLIISTTSHRRCLSATFLHDLPQQSFARRSAPLSRSAFTIFSSPDLHAMNSGVSFNYHRAIPSGRTENLCRISLGSSSRTLRTAATSPAFSPASSLASFSFGPPESSAIVAIYARVTTASRAFSFSASTSPRHARNPIASLSSSLRFVATTLSEFAMSSFVFMCSSGSLCGVL